MSGSTPNPDGPLWEHRRGGPWLIWHRPGAAPWGVPLAYGLMLYAVGYAWLSPDAADVARWYSIPLVLLPSLYFAVLSRSRIVVEPPLIRLGSEVYALADVRVCRRVTDPDEIAELAQRSGRGGNRDLANPRTVLDHAVLVSTGDDMFVLTPPDPDAFVACVLDAKRRGDGVWRRGERRPSSPTPVDPSFVDGAAVVLPDGTRIPVDQLERAIALRTPQAVRSHGRSSSRFALARWPRWLLFIVAIGNPAVATAADHGAMAGGFGTLRVGAEKPQAVRLDLSNPEPLGGDVVMRVVVGVDDADAALAAIVEAANEVPALSSDGLPGRPTESRASWPSSDETPSDGAVRTPAETPPGLPAPLDAARSEPSDAWVPDGWDAPLPPPPSRPVPVEDEGPPGALVPRPLRVIGLALGGLLASVLLLFAAVGASDDGGVALAFVVFAGLLTWPWWRPLVGGPRVLSGQLPVSYALRAGAWVIGLVIGTGASLAFIMTTIQSDVRESYPGTAVAVVESSGVCARSACSTLRAEIDGQVVEDRVSRRYEVGALVEVRYQPDDPDHFVVEEAYDAVGRVLATGVVVVVAGVLWKTRPRRPRALIEPHAVRSQ